MPVADTDAAPLLNFNILLLEQALALVAAHERPGSPAFGDTAGPHLRHVIEHHEALLMPLQAGVADYDRRARDRQLERQPALARQRLLALQRCLRAHAEADLSAPVRVPGLAGQHGESAFAVMSTFGRELAYVASHAVHHHALLRAHCVQHGLIVAETFGVAPATAAHALSSSQPQESSCPVFPA
jgi:hypothetical protein